MAKTSKKAASEAARVFNKLGAVKGGHARAESLTPERRREIAQEAARRRWGVQQKPEGGS